MKKKKSGGGGANWMDTYGDMVTLLLCFFVMSYSMSSMDKERWIALVESFNPEAITETQPGGHEVGTGEGITQADVDQTMAELYESMVQYVSQSGLTDSVSLSQGSGYVFISFDDTVFFDGDSYVLREDGKAVLDGIAQPIAEAADSINEIRVLGHTAQAVPDEPNNVTKDRFLASNRATVVTIYLQEKNIIDPARLISVGYGQWRPVSSNATSEERAHNRRVELVISGLDVSDSASDGITEYYTMRGTADGQNGAT